MYTSSLVACALRVGVRVRDGCSDQCGMWLVGCYLFKACVMRHAVLCRSTRCVVNRQSSRPVCRESCFKECVRLSFTAAAPVCVAPEPRMEPRAGKMLTARVRRSTEGEPEGERAAGRDGRRRPRRGDGLRRPLRQSSVRPCLPVAHVVVPASLADRPL